MDWKELDTLSQLEGLVALSHEMPVLIFKHSTRCAVSRFALKQFENDYAIPDDAAEAFFLDLLEHRDISNEIANRFGVVHQSPQLIILKNGQAVYHISHGDISAEEAGEIVGNL